MQTLTTSAAPIPDTQTYKILIVKIQDHHFGVLIDNIEDIITRNPVTPVPLSSSNIIGLMNLRGQVVTEIDVARTLCIKDHDDLSDHEGYSIVFSKDNEMYSFVFRDVGDVIDLQGKQIEKLPDTVNKNWFEFSKGVFRMNDKLVVILDAHLLIDYLTPSNHLSEAAY